MDELPLLRCVKRAFGEVLADPSVVPWPELPAVALRENASGGIPEQSSWIKTAWDATGLRVLFSVNDTHIWWTYTQRDEPLYDEEVVEVFLAPFDGDSDPRTYFEIEVNPVNAVFDVRIRRTTGSSDIDFTWICKGLRTAVKMRDGGWSAELSIPFASLDALPLKPRWRANFYRIDRPVDKLEELSAWSPTYIRKFHTPERFGILEFVE